LAPSLVDGALIASPWVLLTVKKAWGTRASLPKLADPALQAALSQVFRNGFFIAGGVYFAIWGGIGFASGLNPLLVDAAVFIFTGHLISWLSVFAIVLVNGRVSLVKGLFTAGYYYALHEALWLVLMVLVQLSEAWVVIGFYQYLAAFLAGCLVLYFGAFRVVPKRKEVRVLGLLLLFDAFWLMAGFPVTYNGMVPGFATAFVDSLPVNFIEVAGWVFPAVPLFEPDASAPAIFAEPDRRTSDEEELPEDTPQLGVRGSQVARPESSGEPTETRSSRKGISPSQRIPRLR
jgi:hypothetical protein